MLKHTLLISALALSGASVAQAQSETAVEKSEGKAGGQGKGKSKGKAGKDNQLTAAERKAGWKLLFDGTTTKGWRGYKKQEMPGGWQVVDGALTRVDKGGDIITEDQFGDFELSIDWNVGEAGNSGIIYRAAETESAPWMTGPEYQCLDDERHPDSKAGKDGNHKAGALYDVYPPTKAVTKPAGQWNTTRIVAKGNKIEHYLNGEKVVDAEIGSEDWNKRVAESKWKKMEKWAKVDKGHIALQDHNDKVSFRNIKIRDLAATAKTTAKK